MRRGFLLGNKNSQAKPAERTNPSQAQGGQAKSSEPRKSNTTPKVGASTNFGASSTEQPTVRLTFAGCPTCLDLNPRKATKDNDGQSWAQKEYNVDSDTPAGRFDIDDVATIIKTAMSGCIYCKIIATAMNALNPGWENEKAYFEVYLAKDMPVVVRMKYGSLKTVKADDDFIKQMGVVLPAGQNIGLKLSFGVDKRPDLEIEIYRRRTIGEALAVKGRDIAPLINRLGYAAPRYNHAGDDACFQFIKEQMQRCILEHSCGPKRPKPLLPDRVIWLRAPNESGIKLVEPNGIRADYIALSYCWGAVTENTYLTSASTLESRRARIFFDDLPPLFRDVVIIAQTLGIEYLWIDRLCIIQGDDGDFETQAPKMGSVYGNAALTLAACVESENEAILVPRDKKWDWYKFTLTGDFDEPIEIHFRRRYAPVATEREGGNYGRISTRAWVWQERLLSARTVFFTPAALKFECRCSSNWEGYDTANPSGRSWSAQLNEDSHLSWTHLIEEYTKRNITRPSDRLAALEAVMQRIALRTNWTPIYGHWRESLLETLCWQITNGKDIGDPNPAWFAPTWSWASIAGGVSYVFADHIVDTPEDPFKYSAEVLGLSDGGRSLNIAGQMASTHLRHKDFGLLRRYELDWDCLPPQEDWFPMKADVDLAPSIEIDPRDQETNTTRAPYGQPPPGTDWDSGCYVLLLGKKQFRCLALVLGRSARVKGAWERLGIVDGVPPVVFEEPTRHTITIV